MSDATQALLVILDNQTSRIFHALDGITDDALYLEPGGATNNIYTIAAHLVDLQSFQLSLLESALTEQVKSVTFNDSLEAMMNKLKHGASLVRQAIIEYQGDWFETPETPGDGMWADQPMIERLTKPMNDLTNHLGGIRVIRRMAGNPAKGVQ